jgi:CubicO group peptidase (beta-lactamase class C family)
MLRGLVLPALALVISPSVAGGRSLRGAALRQLVDDAQKSGANALVVWQGGRVVTEQYFGTPPHPEPLMSASKSIVALAVAKLIEEGRIESFDQLVSDFYPEWKQGLKARITLRDLLTQRSGLQNVDSATVEIYPAPDAIKLALAAELSDAPGARFAYNNKATNLLAGIIAIASGEPMDRYIARALFAPMGLASASWSEHDKAGHPYAMSGAQMTARDLVTVGRMMLGRGKLDGKRILGESSVDAILAASPVPLYGMLWWRVPRWRSSVVDDDRLAEMRRAGLDAEFVTAMEKLRGRVFHGEEEIDAAVAEVLGTNWVARLRAAEKRARVFTDTASVEVVAYYAEGFLGEYLVIVPEAQLVAVRLVDARKGAGAARLDFVADARALVE